MDGGTIGSGVIGGELHRFTVADYHRMTEAGVLNEDSRVELIRGCILDMSPIASPHFGMVIRLTRLLVTLLANKALVSVQNPVRLDDSSEPQPDVAVLKPRDDDYATGVPRPADVLLLIEVADSSLAYDRALKMPLYAESGIGEYWVVNLVERVVEVYRQPEHNSYVQVRRVGREGVLDIVALPGVALPGVALPIELLLRPAGE